MEQAATYDPPVSPPSDLETSVDPGALASPERVDTEALTAVGEVPSGNTAVPSGNTAVPSGNTAVPSGNTAVPSGNTAVPSGDTAVPSGNTAQPAHVGASPDAAPMTGEPERLGEYLVGRLLGEGGMGKVYQAEERLSKRKVALKVLRPELSRSEHGRRLFLNEMTILAHLDHPNVVRCLACQETDGELVMALELLEGPTLRALLADRGRLPWTEAVAIASQIAAGLSAAHSQSPPIVHRDLKPDNVALVPAGASMQVKVMDFGIAKVLEALSSTTTHSVGTLQYMSPEQIDAGEIGPRADLYALGLVLFEMLSGAAPFESASPRELLNKQCTEPAPPLPDDVRATLPKGVERLLLSLLEKQPDRRPASAAAVLEALEPFATAGVPLIRPNVGSPQNPATVPPVAVAAALQAQPVPAAVAAQARPPQPADTIGIIERASAPRQVPAPLAMAIIVLLSLVAGVVTYLVRTGEASGASNDTVSATAGSNAAVGAAASAAAARP